MNVTLELYGTVRDAVGEKHLSRSVDTGVTVGDLLAGVAADYAEFGPLVFDSKGRVRPNMAVTLNGTSVALPEVPTTPLKGGDTVTVTPGLAGG